MSRPKDQQVFLSQREPTDQAEGTVVSSSAGLSEVSLPLKTKLQNIEDTERLLKKIKENASDSSSFDSFSSSSMSYSRFKVDKKTQEEAARSLRGTSCLSLGEKKSGDKAAMDNFMKKLKK